MFGILRYNNHESSDTPKNPYFYQAAQTGKYLPKFSYPKKPEIENFKPPKNPSIIPVTRNPEYPPSWAQKANHVF